MGMKSLEQIAAKRGLRVEECGDGHFQIIGGSCLVNYYPHSKRRSAYIAATTGRARRNVTPEQAVEMAFEPAPEGWQQKQMIREPLKRTMADWIALLPRLRFAWKKEKS